MAVSQGGLIDPPAGAWLTADRLRVAAFAVLMMEVWAVAIGVMLPPDRMHLGAIPLGSDFSSFWGTAQLAVNGDALGAYGTEGLTAAQHAGVPTNDSHYGWFYPPLFFLYLAPLAALPYLPAYLFWIAVGSGLALCTIRALNPARGALLAAISFPGLWFMIMHGQNGGLLLACLGGGLVLLERRPIAAGILIGLMSFKPQFGVLIPLALMCGGHWRAFLSAALTTLAVHAVSFAIFGWDTAAAFIGAIGDAQAYLEADRLPKAKMPGPFSFALSLGSGVSIARAVHAIAALATAAAVAVVWWRRAPLPLAGAVLACGAVIVTPFAYDYDLILLAIPIASMTWYGSRAGWWLPGERVILILAWTLPLWTFASHVLVPMAGFQPMTPMLLALFVIAVIKALKAAEPSWQPSAVRFGGT